MMSSLRVQHVRAMTNTISDILWELSPKLSYQNLNFETCRALSSPYAPNMHKSPLRRVSPHEGPLLTFIRARRCMNQCWGLQLPICADPLILLDSDGYLKYVIMLGRYAEREGAGKTYLCI